MSHRTMTLLVQGEDARDAEEAAESFMQDWLDYENAFFDAYEVLTKSVCPLEAELEALRRLEAEYNPMAMAAGFLGKAEALKAAGNAEEAGFWYCRAGELCQKLLTEDIPFYNASLCSYEIPANPSGWFWVPVECHC